ncbi:TetR/AcrR family transcriptional regulator [Tsukamurella paurometabola]|uniref:TetR/AcrR family transcriptional regulator n=3 Tax=Tsukamurella paurometabola TaxID=2061 RepID=A0ABS5NJ76_TSUPA|nr:TetR/AcrR family transcriptional regulator [Tsukamurella paurometabola]
MPEGVDTVNVDATRETLIRVGTAMVDADGIAAVGVRSVAAAAGLSHGAPRRYFPTLAALLAAIAREGVDDLDRALAPALARGVGDAAVAYWRFSVERPHMFDLIFRHDLLGGAGGDLREVTRPWIDALAERLDGIDRAIELWSAIHGLCVLARTAAIASAGITVDEGYVRAVAERLAAA